MKFQKLIDAVALLGTLSLMFVLMVVMLAGSDAKQTLHGVVIPIFKAASAIALSLVIWAAIAFPAMWLLEKVNARCWFGHRKKWLAVYLFSYGHCPAKETHGTYEGSFHERWEYVQIGRWVCEREGCLGMGEKCFGDASKKRYTIEYGRLVKDEKVWANPHAQQEVKS